MQCCELRKQQQQRLKSLKNQLQRANDLLTQLRVHSNIYALALIKRLLLQQGSKPSTLSSLLILSPLDPKPS